MWRRLAEISAPVVDYAYGQRVPLSRLARLLGQADPDAAARHIGDALAVVCETAAVQGVQGPARRGLGGWIDGAVEIRSQIADTAPGEALRHLDERIAEAQAMRDGG